MQNLRKEFAYRKKLSLNAGHRDVTRRLWGFLDWMKGIPQISKTVKAIQECGEGRRLLDESVAGHRRDPIAAQSLEQIASVGAALLAESAKNKRDLYVLGEAYGVSQGRVWSKTEEECALADLQVVLTRFIVPFLDYVEQRLPEPEKREESTETPIKTPAVVHDSLKKFFSEHRKSGSRCFVMMRFGKTSAHKRIEKTIKQTLKKHGLVGLLARDKEYHDELYPNILTYMHGCDFGIAVFERLESDAFNPNVALEVGYMLGLRKSVLLLKDQTLRSLHTDLVGKLYREFNPQNPEHSIPAEIERWLTDKGLA